MADAAPLICVAVVVAVLVIGWMLGRHRGTDRRGGDLVGDQLAARQPVAAAPPTGDLERQLRALLAQRQKIQAIKLVREQTGVGLKEAKDAVERLELGRPLWLASSGPPELPAIDLDLVRTLKQQGKT